MMRRRDHGNPWPRRLLSYLGGVALLLGVAACAWTGLRYQDEAARQLYVAGDLTYVSDADIVAAARPYLHEDFFDLDLDAIRDAVAANPWLAWVEVHRRWPDGLVIRAREHRPVALWGEREVLAADGSVFRPGSETRPTGLPRLTGPAGAAGRVRARLTELRPILAAADHRIVALHMDPRAAWKVELAGGLTLRLGRTDIESRARRFAEHAVPALGERLPSVGYVDMRYGDGFAVGGARDNDADDGEQA